MRLPDISMGPVADDALQGYQRLQGATQNLTGTLVQGLDMASQEHAKSQGIDANLALQKSLDSIHTDLTDPNKQEIPISQVKAALGQDGYDRLPPAIRAQAETPVPLLGQDGRPVLDPATGQPMTTEGRIPTWAVATDLYKARAQKALEDAKGLVTGGPGFQRVFEQSVLPEIVERGSKINDAMLQQFHNYQKMKVFQQAQELARRGNFDGAGQVVDASATLSAPEKLELRQHFGELQQARPAETALMLYYQNPHDPENKPRMEAALTQLADSEQSYLIKDQRRVGLERGLRAGLKAVEEKAGQHEDAVLINNILNDKSVQDENHPKLIDYGKAYSALEAHFAPDGDLADKPERRVTAGPMLKKLVDEHNEQGKYSLNAAVDKAWGEYLGTDAQGQIHRSYSNITGPTIQRLLAEGPVGKETLLRFKNMDEQEEMRQRTRANTPTAQESSKALAIEWAIATKKGLFARMHPGEFQQILLGDGKADAEIPAGAVSARDVPGLSKLFAENAKPTHVGGIDAGIVYDVAGKAYPSKVKAAKEGKQGTEGVRGAIEYAKGQLEQENERVVRDTGAPMSQAAQRKFTEDLFKNVEVRRRILGFIPFGTETTTRADAEARGIPVVEKGAPPAVKPAAKRVKAPATSNPIQRTDPKTGETRTWNGVAWVNQ